MPKAYLAAKFGSREELEALSPLFRKYGIDVCARWVFGGEEGLSRAEIALLDLEDVARSDLFILWTHERGSKQPGGGRFVEMGYALALKKRVVIVGPRENVFCDHPDVEAYDNLMDFINQWRNEWTPTELSS